VQNEYVCLRLVETVRDGHLRRDWGGVLYDVDDSQGKKNLKDCVRDANGKVVCTRRPQERERRRERRSPHRDGGGGARRD
jgi:hypothetical protein